MPLDTQSPKYRTTISLRDAVLELMARRDADQTMSESAYHTELKNLVLEARQPIQELWNRYHNTPHASVRARTYMKYGY